MYTEVGKVWMPFPSAVPTSLVSPTGPEGGSWRMGPSSLHKGGHYLKESLRDHTAALLLAFRDELLFLYWYCPKWNDRINLVSAFIS